VAPTLLAPRMEDGLARFSVVLAAVAAACAALTLLRAPQPARAATRPLPVREPLGRAALTAPFANPAFRWLFAAFIANGIAAALPATLVLFFVNDALGAPQLAGAFLAAYFLAGAASLPLWTALARRMGKRNAWLASMAASVAAFAGALALGPGDVWGFAAVCLLSGLALGGDLALPPAMLADAIRARGDEPRAGAYFGLWNFATKLNLALAAGLALPLLAAAGYVPGTSTALAPLYFAYCLLPCVLKLGAAAILLRVPHA
jgi:Na+/melibiose symporter-like transporter